MKHELVLHPVNLFHPARTTPILCMDSLPCADWSTANFIINGDAGEISEIMPQGIINTVVTSPPYLGQRDYNISGQIGSEDSPLHYAKRLVSIFRGVRNALRDDGTLWLNLGDKYRDGALLGLPWRVALALVDDGWVLRSDVIWHKPNAMPHSVKTRPTTDHEYLFMFSKGKKYYYDADSIREPHVTFSENSKMRGGRNHLGKRGGTPEAGKKSGNSNLHDARWDQAFHPLGRNKRSVEVGASRHVPRGTFCRISRTKLIEPCILAGSPTGGLVLDAFLVQGRSGVVALNHGRRFVGIELNKQYCEMAQHRPIT